MKMRQGKTRANPAPAGTEPVCSLCHPLDAQKINQEEQIITQSKTIVSISILILAALLNSCATTPSVHAWRPYTRVLGSSDMLNEDMPLSIRVAGETQPFLGNDEVLIEEIERQAKQLLQRRGFQVVIDPDALTLNLTFLTETKEFVSNDLLIGTGSKYSSFSNSSTGMGYGAGIGVLVAQMVSGSQQSSSTMVSSQSDLVTSYRHTLSIAIEDSDMVLWQSDATWVSATPSILSELPTALQVIFSNLPNTSKSAIMVPAIKPDREDTFYELYCKNNWFSCPALPYRIRFPQSTSNAGTLNKSSFINDPQAFSAFIDLLQTAEYALPKGSGKFDDPMSSSLWAKAQLGGKYKLGDNAEEVFILIDLV